MNTVQTGTPSSQLIPQNFKNSNQSKVQESVTTRDLLSTPGADVLQVQPTGGKLQVKTGSSSAVLGANQEMVGKNELNMYFPLLFIAFALVMAAFFYNRYAYAPESKKHDEQ